MGLKVTKQSDGITAIETVTIDLRQPLNAAERERAVQAFREATVGTFDGCVRDVEALLRERWYRPEDPAPKYGSKAWYAAEILRAIAAVRANLPTHPNRACLDAVRVGRLYTEARAKHYWPDLKLGQKHRAKQRARSLAGVATKRDARARRDAVLLDTIRACRVNHPTASGRELASLLLPKVKGQTRVERVRAVDALRQRISRLLNRK